MFGTYRLILSLFVVVSHIIGMRHPASAAVFSFYILSGFLMTHIIKERYDYEFKSFLAFCYHRFLRLYPMYWVALLVGLSAVVFVGNEFSSSVNWRIYLPTNFTEWLWNIVIINPSIDPVKFAPRVVSPAWALTVEIFYYILIALGISKTKKITWIWLSCGLIYYCYTFFLGYEFWWRAKSLLCASLPFSVGSILYYYKDSFIKVGSARFLVKVGSIIIYSVISMLSYIILSKTSPHLSDLFLAISFIPSIFCLMILYRKPKVNNKVALKWDNLMGGLSYPFYVLHWPLAVWVVSVFDLNPKLGLTKDGIICFVVVISIMTIVGLLFEKFAEPRVRKLRKLYK